MAAATTCCEACSSEPARRNTSPASSSGRGLDGDQARSADRQRAGLVEQNGMRLRQGIERRAALDDDAAACRLRHAGDERDRRSQYERARCGDHQNGETANRISRQHPRQPGDHDRHRQQQQRVAVRQTNERRLGGLRGGDQPDDAGVGALLGRRRRRDLEGVARVERAAAGALAGLARDRDRLAGQRRLRRRRRPEK